MTIRLLILRHRTPFDERDRHLDYPEAAFQRPPGEIDLEAIAGRSDIVLAQARAVSRAEKHGNRRLRPAAGYRA